MHDFNLEALDEVIHGRVRLGVMAFLSTAQVADFTTLKARLKLTDGNLSVHLRKLEDAGYVKIDKSFVDRRPLTQVQLTPDGRTAFLAYIDTLGALVGSGRVP